MENYKIIKNYLETFPNETTVETLISNIVKAEKTYEENVQKKIEKMKESIGNVYYYEDIDDNDIFVKFVTKITGVKRVYQDRLLYEADMIEISDETIYYLDGTTFSDGDLKDKDLVDSSVFDEAKEKYLGIKNFRYTKD